PTRAPRRDLAPRHVASSPDDGVVRIHHSGEEVEVDVVEAGTTLGYEALRHEPAQKQRFGTVVMAELELDGARDAIDSDAIAGLDLLEQLPEQHRHARHVDKAEHGMVVGALELVTLARRQTERRVV